jgi:hypothetical protein
LSARAIQHLRVGVDWDTGTQREGNGIAGSAVDSNLFAVGLKMEGSIIGIIP